MKVSQYEPQMGNEEYIKIKACFDKNWYSEGPQASEFQQKLLNLIGSKYGVLAPNCTLALYLALKSIGISKGDEVIVPDFTFIATANAVIFADGLPVFCDVNPSNFQIDLERIESLITPKTKAIIPVHIYGTMVNMKGICELAKKYNLAVIEDAAQAIGIYYNKKHAGTFGDLGTFSFFADKTITTGEGGLIVTNNHEIYQKLLLYRNHGRIDRGTFIHDSIGLNLRMTDIQCAIGNVQIAKLPTIVKRKLEILEMYEKCLNDCEETSFFKHDINANFVPMRICVIAKNAHNLMDYMRNKSIEPRQFFYPLHKQPAFKFLSKNPDYKVNLNDENYPNTIYAYNHGICLPTSLNITTDQIKYVCEIIKEFYAKS